MKIRFSKADQIDTTQMGQGGGSVDPAIAQDVEDIKNVVNDGIVDTNNQTRFNYLLRAMRGIIAWAENQDSGDPSLKSVIEEQFADIYSFQGKNAQDSWGHLVDDFDYGYDLSEDNEGE